MDFLPADQRDLQEASYWKRFFEFDRFKEGFEWYASFEDLQPYMQGHFKAKAGEPLKVLVPGCGNSDLSQKLIEKMGLKPEDLSIESFDYEKQIVNKMQESRPDALKGSLNYSFGDCTNLDRTTFPNDGFDIAVDKGTFDAIAVSNDEETIEKC